MRKYYQAALAITATISLIALLFYRHEYNKLRFVLQVVNYFGTPSGTPNETITFIAPGADFSNPSSTWQRLTNDLHVFSSYKIHDEVRTIAFGTNEKLRDTYDCRILASAESPEFIPGEFSSTITSEDDALDVAYVDGTKYYGLLLTCKSSVTLIGRRIFGVQFLDKTKKKSNLVFKVKEIDVDAKANGTVTCVAPSKPDVKIKSVDMVAFIAFHQKIGMENFVVYDSGISDDFHSNLALLARISGMDFTYSKVAWNFPFEGVDYRILRHIIETDCLFRSFGRAELAVTLTWNEFLSLKYHRTLATLVSDFNKVTGQSGDPLALDTLTLCAEDSPAANVSAPVILYSTNRLKGENSKEDKHVYQLKEEKKVFGKRNYKGRLEDMVAVYKYEGCDGDQEVVENQDLRLAKDAVGSKIFQYYVSGKLLRKN